MELNEVSSQLQCRANERQRTGEELELWKAQVHSLMSEKKELEVIGCDHASLFTFADNKGVIINSWSLRMQEVS